MWTVELIVIAAMIALNSVFAAYEIALASIGLARLDTLARQNVAGAASALRMKKSMEASLAVVQVGITLFGAVAAATGGAGAEATIEPYFLAAGFSNATSQIFAIGVVVLPLTVVTIMFGELVPKVFALRNKEWVCLTLSRPMEWFAYSVWPAVWLFEKSVSLIMGWTDRWWQSRGGDDVGSEDAALQELRAIAALARMSRLIGHREEGIIVNAARLARTPLSAIMLPVEYISMLDADSTLTDALIAAHHDMHTRFPVTEVPGDRQRIVGYVNFKDIVSCLRLSPNEPSLRGIVRPLAVFDADMSVSTCLEQMIRKHIHIALVRDKSGTILGVVTMEDILEELVGEIHDEYDRLPTDITRAGESWIVGGNASLAKIKEITGIELPIASDEPVKTINDWLKAKQGRPPEGGDIVRTEGVRILVRKVRRQLLQEAQISRVAVPAPTVTQLQ